MAKLTEFTTPTGAKGNVLNPKDWIGLILGGLVLIVSFATAQNVARAVSNRFPMVDSTIEQPWQSPTVTVNQKQTEVL